MTWFLTQEEAEELLVTVERVPKYTYDVMPNACGPGFGIAVFNADGVLLTESYSPELGLPDPVPDPEPQSYDALKHLPLNEREPEE